VAIVVLVAGFLLAPSSIVAPTIQEPGRHDPIPVAHATGRHALSPSTTRPTSVSTFSPFRSRLKSVLEETNPRFIEESDLGPVSIPNHFVRLVWSRPGVSGQLDTLPLRC
jgi:hypothetical protein